VSGTENNAVNGLVHGRDNYQMMFLFRKCWKARVRIRRDWCDTSLGADTRVPGNDDMLMFFGTPVERSWMRATAVRYRLVET